MDSWAANLKNDVYACDTMADRIIADWDSTPAALRKSYTAADIPNLQARCATLSWFRHIFQAEMNVTTFTAEWQKIEKKSFTR